MKLFKKSVSVFLAILMVFGSVSLLATASDSADYNWEIDTKFYRYDGTDWVETTKAARGESVKARVFMKTDFQFGPSDLFFFYPSTFLTHDPSGYEAGSFSGGYAIRFNTDTTTAIGSNGFGGNLTYGTEVTGQFDNMVYEGYLTEDDIEGKGWLYANIGFASNSLLFDGEDWFFELDFIVNEDATDVGQFYLSVECISDYEMWMAATVIAANPDGDGKWTNYELSCDMPTGTFAYTLNDTDDDSSLSCDNTVVFTTDDGTIAGTTEYTGYIGDTLSTISGFSVPTATADGQQFLGWSTDGSTVLTTEEINALEIGYEPITLSAVFQSAEASYNQNVYVMDTDGKYPETAETTAIGASTGAVVNASSYSVPAGFTLDTDKSTAGDVTVSSDGTSALDIYLKRDQYKATFGETSYDVYYEADYAAPEGPANEGYAFAGWQNGDVLLQEGDTATMGLEDVTYTATYTPAANVAKIVINYVDQTADPAAAATKVVEIATVTENTVTITEAAETGDKITNILFSDERLALEHYKLNTEAANETSKVVAADGSTVLNLYYIPEQYTATFAGADSVTGDYYALKTAPAGPEVAGKTFLGWSLDDTTVALTAGQEFRLEGNAAYTALYENTDYTVTYAFSGTAPEGVDPSVYSTTANMGAAIDLPEMAADGWTFNGWTVSGAVAGDADGEYTVGTSDVTVTGTWTQNTYTVYYWLDVVENDDTYYYEEEAVYGGTVSIPDDPDDSWLPNPGTYFDGWLEDTIEVIDEDTVDMFEEVSTGVYVYNVHANVADIEYTVTVKYKYVSSAAEEEDIVEISPVYYNDVITEDYLLDYADTDAYDLVSWSRALPYTVTSNITITGTFNIKVTDAIFYAEGGVFSDGTDTLRVPTEYGAVIVPSELPTKTGYHLDEDMPWDPDLGEMLDEEQEFWANWAPNEYTITFVVESTSTESTQTYGGNLTVPADVVTEGVKPGYTFKGWTADGGATVVEDLTTVAVPAADTTYTAVYVPSSGGVDYKVNRYFMNTSGNYDGVDADTITLHEVAETEVTYNAEFEGFTLDTTLGNLTASVAGDGSTVLNAYYTRMQPAVTYMAQGTQVDSVNVYYEAALAASTVYTAAPDGYVLLGWSRTADATAADADLGTMDDVNGVTLYAVLDPIEYPVNFVFVYEDNTEAYTATEVSYGAAIEMPSEPTADEVPAGYTFKGWAATAGAAEALDALGTMDTTAEAGKTFYAVLEAKTDIKYNIEKYFMETDGATYTLDVAKSETKTDGVAGVEKTITPDSYEGFTFDSDNADSVLTAVVKGDGSTTFKVYYDRNKYEVTVDGASAGEVYYGATFTAPSTSTAVKDGYSLVSWNNGTYAIGEVITVTGPLALTADTKAGNADYYVQIYLMDVNGDYSDEPSAVETENGTVDSEVSVNHSSYPQESYYSADMAVDNITDGTVNYDGSTVLKLYYKRAQYEVTVDGESAGMVYHGATFTAPSASTATEAGYTLVSWNNGTYAIDEDIIVTSDLALVADNQANTDTAYTVETYVMNVSGSYKKTSEAKTAETDTEITYEPEEMTGFTINETKSVLKGTVTGDGKMTIKVFYDRNKYSVTIDGDTNEYYYGEEIEMDEPEADAGYIFAGWVDSTGAAVTFPYTVAGDAEITSTFDPIEYTVTFKVNGQVYATGDYDYDTLVVDPGAPSAESIPGYTFGGWTKDGSTAVDLATEKVTVGGVTYDAILIPNSGVEYTVKKVFRNVNDIWDEPVDDVRTGTTGEKVVINADDEAVKGFTISSIDPAEATIAGDGSTVIYIYYLRNKVSVTIDGVKKTYYYGEEVAEPEEPTKEGYTFEGWVDSTGAVVTFPYTVPNEDVVINSVLTPNTVSLSFEIDGVTVDGYPVEAEVDSTITAPADPKKEGYNFVDWYIKGTNTAFTGKMPTTDTVYEARFTAGANTKVAIEIYTMNTEGEYEKTVAYTFGVTDTTTWIEPNNELPGLTANLDKSVLSATVEADGSTVLSIYYDRDIYTVTWIVDGKTEEDQVYYGAEITVPADPAKEGYTFTGWTPEIPATMPENDLEFTATWTETYYTVTYVVDGTKTTESYKYGETVTVQDAPEIEGMTFEGWFDNGTEYVAGSTFTMPAEDLIIVADFSIGIYKVTFLDAEGAVFATEMVKFDDEIPVPESKPTKEYYEFTGWNIPYDTMPAMNITVEPIFKRIPVRLIPMEGSTTIIDRDINVITGLKEYIKEANLRNTYLDVEGDGFFTVTPAAGSYCGTGTKIELYDNLDPTTPIETYVIVIYGDINGDSLAQAIDSTYADDENLMITNWSEETIWDTETSSVIANPNYDPYKVMAADLNGDGIIDTTDAQIIGDASIGILRINQVTGRPV